MNKFCFRLPVPVYIHYLNRLGWNRLGWILPRGFSANFVLLIWGLFGGVIFHGLLSNLLPIMLMIKMEEPVDTAQDVLDRGLIPIARWDGAGMIKDILQRSSDPVYKQLLNITVFPENYLDQISLLKENLHGAGTHVFITNVLKIKTPGKAYDVGEEELGDYHWSKEILGGSDPWI